MTYSNNELLTYIELADEFSLRAMIKSLLDQCLKEETAPILDKSKYLFIREIYDCLAEGVRSV